MRHRSAASAPSVVRHPSPGHGQTDPSRTEGATMVYRMILDPLAENVLTGACAGGDRRPTTDEDVSVLYRSLV